MTDWKPPRRHLLFAGLAALLLLTACGGGKEGDDGPTESTQPVQCKVPECTK